MGLVSKNRYAMYPLGYQIESDLLKRFISHKVQRCHLLTNRPTDLLTQTTISKYLTFDVDTGVGFKEAQGHPLEDEVEIGYEGLAVAARKLQQHVQSFQVLLEV